MPRPEPWPAERIARYRSAGWWSDATFAKTVDHWAAAAPERRMLSEPGRFVTWEEARRWTDAAAAALVRAGLERGDVLAVWLPNGVDRYLLRITCEKAGLLWLPIARTAREHELGALLGTGRAAGLVFALSARRDIAQELSDVLPALPSLALLVSAGESGAVAATPLDALAARDPSEEERALLERRALRPEDVAMLIPTSGSTGIPKLVRYFLGGAMARGRAQTELFAIGAEDVIAATVSGFGPSITPLLAGPVAGAEVVLLDHASPEELLETIVERGVSIVCAVPPVHRDILPLLDRHRRQTGVRIWYSTGTPLPPQLALELEEVAGGTVLSGYGGVDFGCWTAPAPSDQVAVRHRTVGKPRGGTELRLIDESGRPGNEGEVVGRGPSSTGGYFGDAATDAAWDAEGWFRTGDIGRFDEDGDLVILGRTVEVINRGGQKIHPPEIEHLLQEHPAVAVAAVVPCADERLGERVCAFVVPRDGSSVTLEELVAFLRERRIASYKLPEVLKVLPSLPLTGAGKVSRDVLRRLAADASPSR